MPGSLSAGAAIAAAEDPAAARALAPTALGSFSAVEAIHGNVAGAAYLGATPEAVGRSVLGIQLQLGQAECSAGVHQASQAAWLRRLRATTRYAAE